MDSGLGRLKAEVVSVLTIFRTVLSQTSSSTDIECTGLQFTSSSKCMQYCRKPYK